MLLSPSLEALNAGGWRHVIEQHCASVFVVCVFFCVCAPTEGRVGDSKGKGDELRSGVGQG